MPSPELIMPPNCVILHEIETISVSVKKQFRFSFDPNIEIGTSIKLWFNRPRKNVFKIDNEASKIWIIRDDKGTKLLENHASIDPEFRQQTHNWAPMKFEKPTASGFDFSTFKIMESGGFSILALSPELPTVGATSLHIEGELHVGYASDELKTEEVIVDIQNNTKVKVAGATIEFDGNFNENNWEVDLVPTYYKKEKPIVKVDFLDEKDYLIVSVHCDNDSRTETEFSKKFKNVKIRVHYSEVEWNVVPINLDVGVGLGK